MGENDKVLRAPPRFQVSFHDGIHLCDIGAHGVILEGGLEYSALNLVLFEVSQKYAALKKPPEILLEAHLIREIFVFVEQHPLHDIGAGNEQTFGADDIDAGDGAVLPRPAFHHASQIFYECDHIADDRQTEISRNVFQVSAIGLVAVVRKNRIGIACHGESLWGLK